MFSRMKRAIQARRVAQQAMEQQAVRLTAALARQAKAAVTVRQLALVQALAQHWLPARLRRVVEQQLQAQLVALPIRMPGSPRSTASSAKTARRSTSKRRRAR